MPTGDIIQQHKMPESRVSSGELKITQSNLHEKGCQLTKVWSDLFSLLSKYQADLMVKENEIEVLEQQLESKQSMLKSTSDNDSREVTNLQGELQAKDLELAKYRADLLNSEEAMNRLQTEMRNNSELLTQCRTEVLENQEKLIKTRSEVDRLRFELTSKDEELRVKDTLLEKLQAQMMKEVSDLTADVNSLKHKLNLEKNAHDETKKTLLSLSKQNQRTDVINIPDSPPMMDLSCDATDEFNLSDVTKSNESGFVHSTKMHSRLLPSSTTSTPSHSQYHPYQRKSSNFSMASATKSQANALSHASNTFGAQNTQPSWTSCTSSSALSRQPEQNESDVFSALSADNSKDSAAFKTEESDPVPVSLSGPSESFDDSSQSLGMDSSQMADHTVTGAVPNPHGWQYHHRSPHVWRSKSERLDKEVLAAMTPEERLLLRRKQATERQRRHRARLKNDPQKLQEVRQRQKMYAQKNRQIMLDHLEVFANKGGTWKDGAPVWQHNQDSSSQDFDATFKNVADKSDSS